MGLSVECEAGCMAFDGGEVKHRRDCAHYPESLTKLWHDTEAELRDEIEKLRLALVGCLNNSNMTKEVEKIAIRALTKDETNR